MSEDGSAREALWRKRLAALGRDVVRARLAHPGVGSGRGALVPDIVEAGEPPPLRGFVEDWLAEQETKRERQSWRRFLILAICAAATVVLGLPAVVVYFSETEVRLKCAGSSIVAGKTEQPASLHARLTQYRWWVRLWSDSHGSMVVERSDGLARYYSHLESHNLGWAIYLDDNPENRVGDYSELSGVLNLQELPWSFRGTCEPF